MRVLHVTMAGRRVTASSAEASPELLVLAAAELRRLNPHSRALRLFDAELERRRDLEAAARRLGRAIVARALR